jgi:hypothetical protein
MRDGESRSSLHNVGIFEWRSNVMKKLMLYFACFALIACLTPALHAAQAAPSDQAFLASLNASPAVQAPADPAQSSPADLFLPTPAPTSCTVQVCEADCNDCPIPKHPYCVSLQTCVCGCR